MFIKRMLLFILIVLNTIVVSAQTVYAEPLLNKIAYQMTAEKWAATTTAKVLISIDATLDKLGLATAHSQILQKLQKIAPADWHIVAFNRSQDKSGLEQLHVEAEARLSEKELASVREQTKSVSRPGETYAVLNIDFMPSNVEMEQAHADTRAMIYNNAKQEIARLNQIYPDLHYFLYSIEFVSPQVAPTAMTKMVSLAAVPASLSVSSKVVETAVVVIGARTPRLQKTN